MWLVGMARDDEHKQVIGALGSLIGRVWIDGRGVNFLYGPSVRVRMADAAVRLERSIALVGGRKYGVKCVFFFSI